MASSVARNWRVLDPNAKAYVEAVALLLKKRYKDLLQMGGPGCLSVAATVPSMVPSIVTSATPEGIKKQYCKHSMAKEPYEERIPPPLQEVTSSSATAAAGTPFRSYRYLKAEPHIVSDPGILDELNLSEISSSGTLGLKQVVAGVNSNLEYCVRKHRIYQEVDFSDSDILQIYHSIDI